MPFHKYSVKLYEVATGHKFPYGDVSVTLWPNHLDPQARRCVYLHRNQPDATVVDFVGDQAIPNVLSIVTIRIAELVHESPNRDLWKALDKNAGNHQYLGPFGGGAEEAYETLTN